MPKELCTEQLLEYKMAMHDQLESIRRAGRCSECLTFYNNYECHIINSQPYYEGHSFKISIYALCIPCYENGTLVLSKDVSGALLTGYRRIKDGKLCAYNATSETGQLTYDDCDAASKLKEES